MIEDNMRKRMYIWPGCFAEEQKLAQHCKSTIVKKKKMERVESKTKQNKKPQNKD